MTEVAADELAELVDLALKLGLDLALDGQGNGTLRVFDLVPAQDALA